MNRALRLVRCIELIREEGEQALEVTSNMGKIQEEEPKRQGSLSRDHTLSFPCARSLSSLRIFSVGMPSHLEDVFSFIF